MEINEGVFESWKFNGKTANLSNVIKLLLLKFLSLFNQNDKKIGFYSMLNTCEINGENLFPFLEKSQNFETVEIMVHPALPEFDSPEYFKSLDKRFASFFKDPNRRYEFDLCFEERFKNYKTSVIED